MEAGAVVWVRDPGPETWIPGRVLTKTPLGDDQYELEIDLERGGRVNFKVAAGETEISDLKLTNSENVALVQDLITLPHLHEPAILHSLSERFLEGQIYTFTGPILIAVNPFKRLPLYTEATLLTYFEQGLLGAQGLKTSGPLPPHVFAIADAAYRAMMEAIRGGGGGGGSSSNAGNQAILISGESGAGKTESTKYVMKYLTTVGAPSSSSGAGNIKEEAASDSVMQKVLQSNPILEAFGNARTIRNDNSSRFGKFIELHFDKRGHLLGASIETYLLEKVRLPHQASNERNFHIFYQLCAGATEAQRKYFKLQAIEEYHYVNQGDCFKLRHVDDRDEFELTLKAMKTLGFGSDNTTALLRITAGLLHLGQVSFAGTSDGEGSVIDPDPQSQEAIKTAAGSRQAIKTSAGRSHEAIKTTAELCHLSLDYLISTLTTRVVETRNESFTVKLRPEQALDARDALSKALYGRLFNWIVAKINACIATDLKDSRATISVLDIFGFECFQVNSFEQLCINYTNETLQQQFNRFVFKMEQEEYEKESIQWSFISFPDNQDCLDLIEGKPNGILAMLDDECKINGNDVKLASRLEKGFGSNPRFFVTKKMTVDKKFGIRHYAGEVAYNTEGFLEKNKDTLPKEATNLFLSSDSDLIQSLFADHPTAAGKTSSSSSGSSTPHKRSSNVPATPSKGGGAAAMTAISVSTQFKQQLLELMGKIHLTRPHYIRCLKPNDENVADKFHRFRVTEQLRYGGVLEAVRVARSGYPVRLLHPEFFSRYRCLATVTIKTVVMEHQSKGLLKMRSNKTVDIPITIANTSYETSRAWCLQILDAILLIQEAKGAEVEAHKILERESVQLGKTKVFLRKVAYEVLEFKRISRLAAAATKIEALFRAASLRREYVILRAATIVLQRILRGMRARRLASQIRRTRASIKLQRVFRAYYARYRYRQFRYATVRLQARYRGRKARLLAWALATEKKARVVQNWLRMAAARRRYLKFQKAVVFLQCGFRKRMAKKQLRDLKQAAKEIGNLQKNNEKLKEELAELREMLQRKAEAERVERERVMEEERIERERVLEEEKKAAAAATLSELEEWKARCMALEKAYEEEKGLRVMAEEKIEVISVEAEAKEKQWREQSFNAAEAREQAKRAELELEQSLKDLQAEAQRRKQLEVELGTIGAGHVKRGSSAEAYALRAGALTPPPPPVLPMRRNSSTGEGGEKMMPERPRSATGHHRLISTLSETRRSRHNSSGSLTTSTPPATGAAAIALEAVNQPTSSSAAEGGSQEEDPLSLSRSLSSTNEITFSAEDPNKDEETTPTASSSSHTTPSSPPQLPSSSSPRARATASPEAPSRTHGRHTSAVRLESVSPPPSSIAIPSNAYLTRKHSIGQHADDLDRSVNLEDEDQMLNKGDRIMRRKEELERLLSRARNYRQYLLGGCQVEVVEITVGNIPWPNFAPYKMRLEGVAPPNNNSTSTVTAISADDLVRARLVWEEENKKKGLFGGLFGGGGGGRKATGKVLDPIYLAELYAVVRGLRRVRPRHEIAALAGGDQGRLLTLTTIQLPDKARRGVVIRFERRDERNHFLDALRKCMGDLQADEPIPTPTTLQRRAITLKGHEAQGPVVPLDDASNLIVNETREARNAFGLVLDAVTDVNGLEDENRDLSREINALQTFIKQKDEQLTKLQEDVKDRFHLLVRVQDMEMENADLQLMMHKFDKAQAAQHQEEQQHKQQQLDMQLQANQDLLAKSVNLQKENVELREKCQRLTEIIERRDEQLAAVRADLAALTNNHGGQGGGGTPRSQQHHPTRSMVRSDYVDMADLHD